MRFLAFCFLASALLLATVDGAALLRFINTVPALSEQASLEAAAAGDHSIHPNTNTENVNVNLDRVGLLYYADSVNTLTPPTTVWTESSFWLQCQASALFAVNGAAQAATAASGKAPFAWDNAMPALRYYHRPSTGATRSISLEKPEVDKVAIYATQQYTGVTCGRATAVCGGVAAAGANANCRAGGNFYPSQYDPYDQSQLKADGVGLYMSFAAGTYRLQAYGSKGTIAAGGILPGDARLRSPIHFKESLEEFTFEDNKVYTLLATGKVNWLVATLTNSVKLVSLEESTARTTFGMASARFVHAITKLPTSATTIDPIDVYVGPVVSTERAPIVKGLKFGEASEYMDFSPKDTTFPIATAASGGNVQGPLPVITTDQVRVTIDLRAGLRATIICAQHDQEVGEVFCRQIPSRVVAYVRLVNDLLDYDGRVQGRFGPETINQSPLSLWQSFQYPRPDVAMDGARNMGQFSKMGNIQATSNGLISVLPGVTAGTVSGYGEVFVPLYIMDWQTDPEIGVSCGFPIGNAVPANGLAAEDLGCINPRPGNVVNFRHHHDFGYTGRGYVTAAAAAAAYTPRFKRVNLILKTAGFASLSSYYSRTAPAAAGDTVPFPIPRNTVVYNTGNNAVNTIIPAETGVGIAPLIDRYMEPGEYYTVYAVPKTDPEFATPTTKAAGQTWMQIKSKNFHNGGNLEFGWTRDRTIQSVAGGIDAKKELAFVTIVPFRRTYHVQEQTGGGAVAVLNTQLGQDFRGTYRFTPRVTVGAKAGTQKAVTRSGIAAGFEWYRSWDQNFGMPIDAANPEPAGPSYWPAAPDPIALQAGTYNFDFEPAAPAVAQAAERRDALVVARQQTWDTACSSNIPQFEFTVEADKFYSLFVLGQYGCRPRALFDTWVGYAGATTAVPGTLTGAPVFQKKLAPILVEAKAYDGATATPTQSQTFFGAASVASSSVSMLLFAAVAALCLAFL